MTYRVAGTKQYFEPGLEPVHDIQPLPAFSVDTQEQAEHLIVWNCVLAHEGGYYLPGFGGELDDLFEVAERFAADYRRSIEEGTNES